MSNSSDGKVFIDNFEKAILSSERYVGQFFVRSLHDKELRIKQLLREELGVFFELMLKAIGGNSPIFPPSAPHPRWKPLSERWRDAKGSYNDNRFYVGKTGRFQDYLKALYMTDAQDRIFGAPVIKLGGDVTSTTPNNLEKVALGEKGRLYGFTRVGDRMSFAKIHSGRTKLSATLDVTVFPNLKTVKGSEWNVVDYLVQHDDAKQWVKVNSRGKNGERPLRPLVLPLVQYFAEYRIRRALEKQG